MTPLPGFGWRHAIRLGGFGVASCLPLAVPVWLDAPPIAYLFTGIVMVTMGLTGLVLIAERGLADD